MLELIPLQNQDTFGQTIEQRRQHMRDDRTCHFVDAATWCALAVGRQPLTRCDDETLNLAGLVNALDGTRYFIESEELLRHLSVPGN